jgi:hypothetical protein
MPFRVVVIVPRSLSLGRKQALYHPLRIQSETMEVDNESPIQLLIPQDVVVVEAMVDNAQTEDLLLRSGRLAQVRQRLYDGREHVASPCHEQHVTKTSGKVGVVVGACGPANRPKEYRNRRALHFLQDLVRSGLAGKLSPCTFGNWRLPDNSVAVYSTDDLEGRATRARHTKPGDVVVNIIVQLLFQQLHETFSG